MFVKDFLTVNRVSVRVLQIYTVKGSLTHHLRSAEIYKRSHRNIPTHRTHRGFIPWDSIQLIEKRPNRLGPIVFAALCFATLVLYLLLVGHKQQEAGQGGAVAAISPTTFSGKLDIRMMTDLRVGGRKIILCGVSFARPASMEPFMREQARRALQGAEVYCTQVGGGTPCDGRAAPSFNGAIVAQCRTQDGSDIAHKFAASGYLCDLPAQSGGTYHAC